jgi:hypothetical protein
LLKGGEGAYSQYLRERARRLISMRLGMIGVTHLQKVVIWL